MLHPEFRYSVDYQDTRTCPSEVFILKVQYAPSGTKATGGLEEYPLWPVSYLEEAQVSHVKQSSHCHLQY